MGKGQYHDPKLLAETHLEILTRVLGRYNMRKIITSSSSFFSFFSIEALVQKQLEPELTVHKVLV
jgi:hypothetical protein